MKAFSGLSVELHIFMGGGTGTPCTISSGMVGLTCFSPTCTTGTSAPSRYFISDTAMFSAHYLQFHFIGNIFCSQHLFRPALNSYHKPKLVSTTGRHRKIITSDTAQPRSCRKLCMFLCHINTIMIALAEAFRDLDRMSRNSLDVCPFSRYNLITDDGASGHDNRRLIQGVVEEG